MKAALLVFIGGGLGSLARYGVTLASNILFAPHFPFSTLFVNITGGLVMGFAAGYLVPRLGAAWVDQTRLFVMTGILGGFTTFSAFSLDAVGLWERGLSGQAALYVVASVVFSISALMVGLMLARILA